MPDFVSPTYQTPLGVGRLFGRYMVTEPASLVRDVNGAWTVVVEPDAWQLDVSTAHYLGGYDNVVSSVHVQEMISQGLTGVLYWRAYGEGLYGGGDYGG